LKKIKEVRAKQLWWRLAERETARPGAVNPIHDPREISEANSPVEVSRRERGVGASTPLELFVKPGYQALQLGESTLLIGCFNRAQLA